MNIDLINERYYGDPNEPATERTRQRIHWICSQATGNEILDIGCSQGIACLILGREGFQCTGVDIEAPSLEVAWKALAEEDPIVRRRVRFQVADASQLPFEEKSFDTVVLGEVLEHLTHPDRVLSEAKRVLRDGGRLIVTVPYGLNAYHDHKRTFYPISLLELLQPLFKARSIDTLNNYLTYTGVKESGYSLNALSKEVLFDQYLRLEKMVEIRCLEKERTLMQTGTKLQAQIRTLKAQTTTQAGRLKEIKEASAKENGRVFELEQSLTEARHAAEAAREETARKESELTGLRAEVVSSTAALAAVNQQLTAIQMENAGLREKYMSKEEVIVHLQAEAVNASAALSDARKQIATFKKESETASALAQQELMALEIKNAGLLEELAAKHKMVETVRSELGSSTATLTSVYNQLNALQQENASLRERLVSKEEVVVHLQAEAVNANSALSDARQEVDALKKESETASALAQQGLKTLETINASLREEVAAKDEKVATVSSELSSSSAALAVVNKQLAALQTESTTQREKLKEKDAVWQHRLADRLREREKHLEEIAGKREIEWKRVTSNQRIREIVRLSLPAKSQVLVISRGDEDLLQLDGRHGWHFPQAPSGVYAGHHPGNSAEAIAHLESLKAKGGEFLLIPGSAFWWLDFYSEFRQHLEANYRLMVYEAEVCMIYALSPAGGDPAPLVLSTRESIRKDTNNHKQDLNNHKPMRLPTQATVLTPTAVQKADQGVTPVCESPNEIKLGAILDEFTTGCLQPDCKLITFRPDNWKKTLEQGSPHGLLVESAWHGNGGSWQYKIASFKKPMGEEIVDVVEYCRKRNIPSVFWNKEDPVHFERFIDRARLFSHVFTTDADCIPRYRENLGHERVFALPFAAQPAIHNPIKDSMREGSVCFAGTYYGNRHEHRQADMEHILRPAISFGLEIYDRQHGMTGKDAASYRFPDIYQPCIKGRLNYDEMVKAYKRYKVFLNVNSVKQSPTMFSRRVFELLACGTPVVSTYSRGIVELLGEDVVFITESEADTCRYLERLLGSEEEWAKASVRGIRKVMGDHTYRNRLQQVLGQAGIAIPNVQTPRITAFFRVTSKADLQSVATLLSAQTYRRYDVILLSKTRLPASALVSLRNALANVNVTNIIGPSAESFAECQAASTGEYWAFFDLRDAYGPNYLKDHSLAAIYSHADFLGKHTYYTAPDSGKPQLKQSGHDFQYVTSVESATLFARKTALSTGLFEKALNNRLFREQGKKILSIDRFNYFQNAGPKEGKLWAKSPATVQCSEVYA